MHRSRHALALALACLALGLLDVARASLRSPLSIDLWLTLVAWLVATGAALTIAGPLLWLRMQIVRTLPARFWFAIGALDGAFVGHYGLMREKTASVPRARLELIAYSCVVVGAAVAAVAPRVSRRILPWLSLASALGVLAVAELLPAREKQWLRFALDMVALGGLATALDHLLEARVRRALPARFIGPSLLACALASHGTLHEAEQVRRFVFDFAAHSQAFLWPLREYTPAPRGRDPALGPVACAKAGFSARPAPAPLRAATRTGAARGADVLMVSIDALRHDRVDTLPELWKAVGPHARFTRAAAPAPRTMNSLSALVRGVTVRQIPFAARWPSETVLPGAPPTIAEVLVERGYRAVQVPTHRYFRPKKGMNRGFELVPTDDFDETTTRKKDGYPIVRAETAYARAVEIAEQTAKPLLLWVHAMETHEPYRWDGGKGPFPMAARSMPAAISPRRPRRSSRGFALRGRAVR